MRGSLFSFARMSGVSLLWRQRHAFSLRLLLCSLVVAVTAVMTIVSVSDVLKKSLAGASSTFMAGDRQLTSPREVPEAWLQKAQDLGLTNALSVEFTTMMSAVASEKSATMEAGQTAFQLVTVKAVDSAYPLKGVLEIAEPGKQAVRQVQGGPEPGRAWLQTRLFNLMHLDAAQEVRLGEYTFAASAELRQEPDVSFQLAGLAPRVMISYQDLARTAVIQPGSRVKWRYYFAGDEVAIEAFEQWLKPQLVSSQKWQSLREGRPAISGALAKADSYLLLGGSLSVLLAALAIAISARQFAIEQTDQVAIIKALGMSGQQLTQRYCVELVLLACVCILVGSLLGVMSLNAWLAVMRQQSDVIAAEGWVIPPVRSIWLAVGTVGIFLLAFAYPQLARLQATPPMRVLRQNLSNEGGFRALVPLMATFGVLGLLYWYGRDLGLLLILLMGLVLVFLLVAAVHSVLLAFGERVGLGRLRAGSAFKLTLQGLLRRRRQTVVQLSVFTIALFLFSALYLTRTGLINDWQAQLPEDAPNHFLINIAPDAVDEVQAFLAEQDIAATAMYPMVRGRLSHINGVDVKVAVTKDVGALNRELNLSWASELPEDNRIEQGRWWSDAPEAVDGVSVESELADKLGLILGDRLTFAMPGQSIDAVVTSIRSVQWDSMRPNFYMMFPEHRLQPFPTTYITAFYLSPEQKSRINAFSRTFPTVSVLEMDRLIAKIKTIVDQVSVMVELILGFVLLASLLVLAALVAASREGRAHEAVILRTFGATKTLLHRIQLYEFFCIGLLAAMVAVVGAELSVYLLKQRIFEGHFHPALGYWVVMPLVSASILACFGYLQTRKIPEISPMRVLRGS